MRVFLLFHRFWSHQRASQIASSHLSSTQAYFLGFGWFPLTFQSLDWYLQSLHLFHKICEISIARFSVNQVLLFASYHLLDSQRIHSLTGTQIQSLLPCYLEIFQEVLACHTTHLSSLRSYLCLQWASTPWYLLIWNLEGITWHLTIVNLRRMLLPTRSSSSLSHLKSIHFLCLLYEATCIQMQASCIL